MVTNGNKIGIIGLWFIFWTGFLVWLVLLMVNMICCEWGLGVTGFVCMTGLFVLTAYMMFRYGSKLWRAYDDWRTLRLKERYRRKYIPYAENELFLRKEYNDTIVLASALYPLFLGKSLSLKAEILFAMLEELERKESQFSDKIVEES